MSPALFSKRLRDVEAAGIAYSARIRCTRLTADPCGQELAPVVEPDQEAWLCSFDPEADVDLYVASDLKRMTEIWMGYGALAKAVGKLMLFSGYNALVKSIGS